MWEEQTMENNFPIILSVKSIFRLAEKTLQAVARHCADAQANNSSKDFFRTNLEQKFALVE